MLLALSEPEDIPADKVGDATVWSGRSFFVGSFDGSSWLERVLSVGRVVGARFVVDVWSVHGSRLWGPLVRCVFVLF